MTAPFSRILSAQFQELIALNRQRSAQGHKWKSSKSLKVLLITEKSRIPQSQIFPFFYYASQFKARWNVEFKEINADAFEAQIGNFPKNADRIFFQPWLVKGERRITQILERLRHLNPDAKIAFFDINAPTDLRFAETLNTYIDWYVKRHVLLNRLDYARVTFGDTKLVEYYNRLCGNPEAKQTVFPVSQSLMDKMIIGPSFFTSREMLPYFDQSPTPLSTSKKINLNARIKTKGSKWFNSMRTLALKSCLDIPFDSMVITDASVSDRQYKRELRSSRACFSPFGYGEVCWRDFEAILYGALLIKPDMSHVETAPQFFDPFKTYIPVTWDFADVDDKVSYYLDNEDITATIVDNAYKTIHNYVHNGGILDQYARLFE